MLRPQFLYFIIIILPNISAAELFSPTQEWKEVGPDEIVPAGNIHIRMDFQTGKRFAKISEDEKTPFDKSVSIFGEKGLQPHEQEKPSEMYRPLEDIKREFDSLMSKFEFEHTTLARTVGYLKNHSNDINEQLIYLDELESMLHGFDNAKLFVQLEGLEAVLKLIDTTDLRLTCMPILRLLFASLQNNDEVQNHFSIINGTQHLMKIIGKSDPHFSRCHSKTASVVSASIRGCFSCFERFFKFYSSVFIGLLDLRDDQITLKMVDMLTLFYQESQHSKSNDMVNVLKEVFVSNDICSRTKPVISQISIDMNGDLKQCMSMLHHLCGDIYK